MLLRGQASTNLRLWSPAEDADNPRSSFAFAHFIGWQDGAVMLSDGVTRSLGRVQYSRGSRIVDDFVARNMYQAREGPQLDT